jgi:hypothetical protein
MKVTKTPCVYFLFDGEDLVYIGKTDNIFYRIGTHLTEGQKKFDRFEMFETKNNDRLEALLITLLKPKYNKLVPKAPVIESVSKSVDKSDPFTGDWFKNAWDETSAIFDSAFKEVGTI